MTATVFFDKGRGKWFLLNRVGGKRKKAMLGPTDADRDRGLAAAAEINRRLREDGDARGRLAGGLVRGRDAFTAWWNEARPGLADSTRVTVEGFLRLHLQPHFGGVDLARLTREQVRAFAGKKADEGLGQHAIQGALSVLRRVLRWLVEKNALERMPVDRIVAVGLEAAAARGAQKGAREAFTHDEAAALLEFAPAHLYALIFTACQTGARKGELLALTWPCVHFGTGEIEWRSSRWHQTTKATKSNKVRRSTMSPQLREVLQKLARRDRHVFLDRRGKPWLYDSLSGAWKRLRRLAQDRHGVRPLPFHSWRHTFVSWALTAGADPLWVAAQIGDRPETMLKVYAHLVKGRLQPLDFLRINTPDRPADADPPRGERHARRARVRPRLRTPEVR